MRKRPTSAPGLPRRPLDDFKDVSVWHVISDLEAIGPNRSRGDYVVAKSGLASSFLSFAIAGSLLVICRVSAVCIRGSSA